MFRILLKRYLTPKYISLAVLFLIFFFLLRWNHFTAPFERDEGVYSYSAWIMRKGLMPYEYSFPYKPPMIIFTYLIGQVVFGDNIFSPRILAAVFSFFTVIIAGLIAKKEYGSTAGWFTVFLLSVMLILPVNFGNGLLADVYYAANTEIFMVLPLTLLLYLYVFYKDKSDIKTWFFAGILSALAINYKPICLLTITYIFIFWLIKVWKSGDKIPSLIKKIVGALVGFLLISFIIYLPFLISDGGRSVTEELLNFTKCYATTMNVWKYGINQFIYRIFIMGKYYWMLYLLFIYFLFKKTDNRIFYSGLLLISFISVYQSVIGHYFIQIMPFFALVSAGAFSGIIKEKIFSKKMIFVFIAVIASILLPIKSMFAKSPNELGLWVYGRWDPNYEAEIVGSKMAEITKPDDYVFTQGDDIEITYFSQRRSTLRFEQTSFFISSCEMLNKYKDQAMIDFKIRKPAAIVICQTGSCSYFWKDENAKPFIDFFTSMLKDDYIPVGGWIPDRGGYWLEPISEEDIPYARSLLYRRR